MTSRRFGQQSLIQLLGHWQQTPSRIPLWQQLAAALRLLILDGRLVQGARLPGERELASGLNISRTTVSSALAQLREQGFLQSRQGSGSQVVIPASSTSAHRAMSSTTQLDLSTASLTAGAEIHQAYTHAMELLPSQLQTSGYNQKGVLPLRESIAQRYCLRGLPTTPDQVMVVNGAVSGLALILRLLAGPGDRVLVDHPTYPSALSAIRGASCQAVGVPLLSGRWDITGLKATIAQTSPRLAYLIADYNNPTGYCMDEASRAEIAAIAAQSRTPLVIDETLAELWYHEPPPLPVAAFSNSDQVISLGSASKSFWGGLRIGWIRASPSLITSLIQIRDSLDLGSPLLSQLAVGWLLDNSDNFLAQRRHMLKQQRDDCQRLMQEYFPEWKTSTPAGGLSFWVELPGMQATQFSSRASDIGILLGTGTRFGLSGAFDRYLRIPFTSDEQTLRRAFQQLQPLWSTLPENTAAANHRKIF